MHTSEFIIVTGSVKSEALEAARPIGAGAYPGFCSMKRLEVFPLPLDGMLVHRRSLPRKLSSFPQQFAGTHLYTWVERGTVRNTVHMYLRDMAFTMFVMSNKIFSNSHDYCDRY